MEDGKGMNIEILFNPLCGAKTALYDYSSPTFFRMAASSFLQFARFFGISQ